MQHWDRLKLKKNFIDKGFKAIKIPLISIGYLRNPKNNNVSSGKCVRPKMTSKETVHLNLLQRPTVMLC